MARRFNFRFFKFYVKLLESIGAIRLTVKNKEALAGLKSKVVVANHPSLLDVVILFSLIPNADCVVKSDLLKNKFISLIIKNLYIPNNLEFNDQLEQARLSMSTGNNLIIFPEGTRSRPNEPWEFKKGAARFALYSKNDIVPIFFGGNEKIGLRKHDKILQIPPKGSYIYSLKVLPTIAVAKYDDVPMTISAIKLTKEIKATLEREL